MLQEALPAVSNWIRETRFWLTVSVGKFVAITVSLFVGCVFGASVWVVVGTGATGSWAGAGVATGVGALTFGGVCLAMLEGGGVAAATAFEAGLPYIATTRVSGPVPW